FRGDLDHIDTLKSLPVAAWAIAVAELVAPVAVLTIYQLVLLASIDLMLHTGAMKLAIVMLFALPLNAMLIAVENLIFLIFPVRLAIGVAIMSGLKEARRCALSHFSRCPFC